MSAEQCELKQCSRCGCTLLLNISRRIEKESYTKLATSVVSRIGRSAKGLRIMKVMLLLTARVAKQLQEHLIIKPTCNQTNIVNTFMTKY